MADEVTGWPSSSDAYQLTSRIGQGAFSEVWKARCIPKNVPVAVKVMDLENINSTFEDITQEVSPPCLFGKIGA
jgi:serine/threonine-protein kinase OSR1/STK39